MKQIFLFLLLVVSYLGLIGQPLTAINSNVSGSKPTFVAQGDISATSDLGSEQYSITLVNRSELLGNSTFIATNSAIGDIIIDGNGGIYEIISGTSPIFTIQLLNDLLDLPEPFFGFPAAPTPPVNIARPIGQAGLLPSYAFLGSGIDSRLIAIIDNYNKNQLGSKLVVQDATTVEAFPFGSITATDVQGQLEQIAASNTIASSNAWNMPISYNTYGQTTKMTSSTLNSAVAFTLVNASTDPVLNHADIQAFCNNSSTGTLTLNAPAGYTIAGAASLAVPVGDCYWLQVDSVNNTYRIIVEPNAGGNTDVTSTNTLNATILSNIALYGIAPVYSTSGGVFTEASTTDNTTLHQFYVRGASGSPTILGAGAVSITATFAYTVGTTYYLTDAGTLATSADNDGDAIDYISAAVYCVASLGSNNYIVNLKDPVHFVNN